MLANIQVTLERGKPLKCFRASFLRAGKEGVICVTTLASVASVVLFLTLCLGVTSQNVRLGSEASSNLLKEGNSSAAGDVFD
jgi:hypothetical protein